MGCFLNLFLAHSTTRSYIRANKVCGCVDMRAANKAIRTKRHATPTVDELKTVLSGAKVFSKLDLNRGYNHPELVEESRYITTLATHLGLSLV